MAADGTITLSTKIDTSGLNSGMSKMKSGAAKLGKAFAVVGVAATTAFVAVSKSAVESYAEYEQLVGGVETLFKTSSDVVMNYANQAYETARMSANMYMETVTGFSASLLQSLGGDTAKAAEYGNQAVIDMSDNANKIGTDMQRIQDAYQGFAKQNYTMLDNLKLGYGGTRTEMERLLADAEKIKAANGEMASYSVDSFADIVEAIHVVQENMGIAGTTAEEASTTIQGSINMMKGAWQNLLTGLADPTQDMGVLIDNLVSSIQTVGRNVIPVVQNVINGIFQLLQGILPQIEPLIQQLLPVVIEGVNSIAQGIMQVLPSILTAIIEFLPQIINTIIQSVGTIIEALPQIITVLVEALPVLLPQLISGIVNLVVLLVESLPQIIQPIIESIPILITSIVTALIENLPILIDACILLVAVIVESLPQIIMALLEAVGNIAVEIGQVLFDTLPEPVQNAFTAAFEYIKVVWDKVSPYFEMIWNNISTTFSVAKDVLGAAFETSWTVIKAVWDTVGGYFEAIWDTIAGIFEVAKDVLSGDFEGAWNAIKGIVSTWASFFSSVWESIKAVFSVVVSFFQTTFTSAWNGVKTAFSGVKTFFTTVWNNIKNVFSNVLSTFVSVGKNIVQGIINGVTSAAGGLYNAIRNLLKNALSAAQNAIDSHSPSRLFRDEIGKMISAGVVIGIESGFGDVKKAGADLAKSALKGAKKSTKEIRKTVTKLFKSLTEDTRTEVQKIMDDSNEELLESEIKYNEECARIEKEREEKEWQTKLDNAKTEEERQKIHNERMEKEQQQAEDAYLQGLKETADKEREIFEAQQKDVENLKKNIVNTFSEMAEEAFDKIEELEKTQESFAKKLSDYGGLYTEVETKAGWKRVVPADLDQQIIYLEDYYSTLEQLKDKGDIPKEFFEIIRDMGVEEGSKFASALLELPEDEFNKYIADWKRKQELSQNISKALYADEAEELKNEIMGEFEDVEKEFFEVGGTAAEYFGEGFLAEFMNIILITKESILSAFSSVTIPVGTMISSGIATQSGGVTELHVPAMAKGGVVPRAMVSLLGENGREAVLPLERNTEWMDLLADKVAQRNGFYTQGRQVIREEHYHLGETELMTLVYKLAKAGQRINGGSFIDGGVL